MERKLLCAFLDSTLIYIFLVYHTKKPKKTLYQVSNILDYNFLKFLLGPPHDSRTTNRRVIHHIWNLTLKEFNMLNAMSANFPLALKKYKILKDKYMLYTLFNLGYSLNIDIPLIHSCVGVRG
jgi:hypothetical protein